MRIPTASVAIIAALASACGGSNGGGARPPTVQFTGATYTVDESAGSLTILVRRGGNASGNIFADYGTADGTAVAGQDYTATSGTLDWIAGDATDRSITVPVIDDTCADGDLDFEVVLSNPSPGLVLGSNRTATVTITDDEIAPPGSLDPAFGTAGVVSDDPGSGYDTFTAVAIDGGFIYATGFDEVPGSFDWRWRIEKRSVTDGSLDPAFGPGGVAFSDPSLFDDSPYDLAVDGGSVFVAGYDESPDPAGGDWQWRVEKRSLAHGSLDPAFGTAGVVTVNPTAGGDDEAQSIAVGGTFIYIGGYDQSPGLPDWQWRIEKRSAADGSPDPTFGSGGVVVSNNPGTSELVYQIALDGTHLYAAGFDTVISQTDRQWRVEKRRMTDGGLDPAFGSGGVLQVNPGPGIDSAFRIVLDATHLYIAGDDSSFGSPDVAWRVEKRALTDGALEPLFGLGGVVVSNPSPDRDQPWGMALDGTDLYLAGSDAQLGSGDVQWRIEKRSSLNGSLDGCFGSPAAISNPSPAHDDLWDMVIDGSSVFVVGEDQTPPSGDQAMRMEKRNR